MEKRYDGYEADDEYYDERVATPSCDDRGRHDATCPKWQAWSVVVLLVASHLLCGTYAVGLVVLLALSGALSVCRGLWHGIRGGLSAHGVAVVLLLRVCCPLVAPHVPAATTLLRHAAADQPALHHGPTGPPASCA